jgi:hypothetical protein
MKQFSKGKSGNVEQVANMEHPYVAKTGEK